MYTYTIIHVFMQKTYTNKYAIVYLPEKVCNLKLTVGYF